MLIESLENWQEVEPSKRIMVALDLEAKDALSLAEELAGLASWMKVGMTLYYAEGPSIVKRMHELGFQVFLDLKFHDIPHQVRGAARSAALSGADLMTMHAVGGIPMMRAGIEGAAEAAALRGDFSNGEAGLLAITVLTSMDAETLAATGVTRSNDEQVRALALQAKEAGASGIVCSPLEASSMRELLGEHALIVTPGIRPADGDAGDQSRIATPKAAFEAGASHIVIGRPITQAPNPREAFEAIAASLA